MSANEQEIFRKKSLDKIKSPESLNDYIRVSNPGVWLLLVGVVLLLVGACIWGIFGRIDTTLPAVCEVENGIASFFVEPASAGQVGEQITVNIDGTSYEVQLTPAAGENTAAGLVGSAPLALADGRYPVEIVTESLAPLSFVFN